MISNLANSDTHISKTIGNNIRVLRETSRLSRRQLSLMMGISYQQLYKYELGYNRISAVNLVYLKFYLNADYNDFFKGLF